jgi:hypothetical protein
MSRLSGVWSDVLITDQSFKTKCLLLSVTDGDMNSRMNGNFWLLVSKLETWENNVRETHEQGQSSVKLNNLNKRTVVVRHLNAT